VHPAPAGQGQPTDAWRVAVCGYGWRVHVADMPQDVVDVGLMRLIRSLGGGRDPSAACCP
jgi:hypothetical protein